MLETVKKYFPNLTENQIKAFERIMMLYPEWNEKINVISRKDIHNLEVNHILHSLSIAKLIAFMPESRILDFGAGGGFPSIPLAILYPNVHFHLVDRVGKKLKVASSIANEIGLNNVSVQHGDISECREKFDFVVSRAVMNLQDLVNLSKKNIAKQQRNAIPNGLITLKGGDLQEEIKPFKSVCLVEDISNHFSESFFETKKIIYLPL